MYYIYNHINMNSMKNPISIPIISVWLIVEYTRLGN